MEGGEMTLQAKKLVSDVRITSFCSLSLFFLRIFTEQWLPVHPLGSAGPANFILEPSTRYKTGIRSIEQVLVVRFLSSMCHPTIGLYDTHLISRFKSSAMEKSWQLRYSLLFVVDQ